MCSRQHTHTDVCVHVHTPSRTLFRTNVSPGVRLCGDKNQPVLVVLILTKYALWSLGHCKHLTLLIQAGADEKNLPGWWKLRPWLSKPKTQGSPIVAGRGAGAKKTLTCVPVFRDLRRVSWKDHQEFCALLGNPGCVYQLFDSISVCRGESQTGNSSGLIDFCALCNPLEFLEILLNPQRIRAMTKILWCETSWTDQM